MTNVICLFYWKERKLCKVEYRIYEHIIGLPDHLDTPLEELEVSLEFMTADQAEKFIRKYISDVDKFGRKRRVYVYREEK